MYKHLHILFGGAGSETIQQKRKKYFLKAQLTPWLNVWRENLIWQYWKDVYFETKASFGSLYQISWPWIEQK